MKAKWGIVFEEPQYHAGEHVVEQLRKRISNTLDESKAKTMAQYLCKTGQILLDTPSERFIRNEGFTFPCVKVFKKQYVIKTLLTKDMEVKS